MAQSLSYAAVVLDSASQQKLKVWASERLPWAKDDSKLYCHHSTIAHHTNITPEVLQWCEEHAGEIYTLVCTEVGYSNLAFALRVECPEVPCVNAIRHVTLATHTSNGGQAVDSNNILYWQPLSHELTLSGKVSLIYKED